MNLPVGHERYLSTTPGLGGKLRAAPDDFTVTELSLPPPWAARGKYTLARVTARNRETNRLIHQLARRLGISEHQISFAGTKDKRAVTTRLFAFRAPPEAVAQLTLPEVKLEVLNTSHRPLKLGDLVGNRFAITLRNPAPDAGRLVAETAAQLASGFPNYFGIQRFGAVRPITHRAGAALLAGDFRATVLTYVADEDPPPEADGADARRYLALTGDWTGTLERLPPSLLFERQMVGHLTREPDDFAGALRCLPANLLRMFVHAYQAALFNRMIELRLERGLPLGEPCEGDLVLPADSHGRPNAYEPIAVTGRNLAKLTLRCREERAWVSGLLPGARCDVAAGAQGEIERQVMREAGVGFNDFVLHELPEVSSRGTRRALHQRAHELAWEAHDDRVEFAFWLYKGTYATTFLREFMKSDRLMDY